MNYRSSIKALLIFLLVITVCSISACGSASSGTTPSAASSNSSTAPAATATQSALQKLLLTPSVNQDCAAQVPVSIEDVDALLQETFNPFTGGYPVDLRICDLRGSTTGRQVTVQFIVRGSDDAYWKTFADGAKQLSGTNGSTYEDFTLLGADAAFSITAANHGEVSFKKGSDICDVIVSTVDAQSPGSSPGTDQAKQLAQLFAKRL